MERSFGPSQDAQRLATLLRFKPTSTGEWQANNEEIARLQAAMKSRYAAAGDSLNRAFYDATRGEAMRRRGAADATGNSRDREHMSYLQNSLIENNGSQMNVPGATFQLPTGDQQMRYLRQMAQQGANIGDAAYQMAADNDYLFGVGRDGAYASGSLGNWMGQPLAYRSLNGPAKQIVDIDQAGADTPAGREAAYEQWKAEQTAIRQHNDAWRQITNQNPLGRPTQPVDGQSTVKFYGDPRKDYGVSENLAWEPAFLRQKNPNGDGLGIGGQLPPVKVPTQWDTWKENQATSDWYRNNMGIETVSGNGAGWRAYSNESKTRQLGSLPAFGPAMAAAEAPQIIQKPVSQPAQPIQAAPKPAAKTFGGALSPSWLEWDRSNRTLFGSPYEPKSAPAPMGNAAFSRYANDPITAGVIEAQMADTPFAQGIGGRPSQAFGR